MMKLAVCCLVVTSLSVCFGVNASATENEKAERPNIVFILADDMGWNQPSFNGGDPVMRCCEMLFKHLEVYRGVRRCENG
ncbi:hypothetical protein N9048_02365 [bacterium]|nr:hypothetical protein [bacterium]